jgi:hypothetical protein
MAAEKARAVCLVLGMVLAFEKAALVQSPPSSGPFTVTLAWDPPVEEQGLPTSYVIEAGSRPGRSNLAVFEIAASAEPRLVVDGVPAGTYYVRVRARNFAGLSEPSNEIVVTVGDRPCAVPVAPAGLTSTTHNGVVTLRWVGSPGATSYELEAGSGPGMSDLFRGDVGDLNMLAAWAPPVTVFVRVRAKNNCGLSPASNEVPAG